MRNNPVQITRNKTEKIEPVPTGEEVNLTDSEKEILDALAGVLEYPANDWNGRLLDCGTLCAMRESEEFTGLRAFAEIAADMTLNESQELYTRTFDLSPVCALEIGYHLFGEDYKRGAFLAQLRETENPYVLGQEHQLPDYLPVVLRLLGRLENAELSASLIGYCLLPALKKMNAQLNKKKNPYEGVLSSLESMLQRIAKDSLPKPREASATRYQHV